MRDAIEAGELDAASRVTINGAHYTVRQAMNGMLPDRILHSPWPYEPEKGAKELVHSISMAALK